MVVFLRNKLFDWEILKSSEFAMPVISVGNITVGGTGKTPHIEYLVNLLSANHKVAVLSRGYKRKTKGFILASELSGVNEIGDEPLQIKSKFPEVIVAVDSKRTRGIEKLMELFPDLEVILLDDAFQHRYVKPGLSILLIDYNRPLQKDFLLPMGRLREPASSVSRANLILISKSPEKQKDIERRIFFKNLSLNPFQHLFYTAVNPQPLKPVFMSSLSSEMLDKLKSKPKVLLIAGIANPRSVKKFARVYSTDIEEFLFPDHYEFKERDIQKIVNAFNGNRVENTIIITTEKDAMRLKQFHEMFKPIEENIYYIPIIIEFLNEDTKNFNNQINSYVESNRRNSILYKRKDKI
jgi:tetraacyldisaccharide 4'-kinase